MKERSSRSPYFPQVFRRCADCGREFVSGRVLPGRMVGTGSHYPYCYGCFMRRMEDPEFKKWIVKLFKPKGAT